MKTRYVTLSIQDAEGKPVLSRSFEVITQVRNQTSPDAPYQQSRGGHYYQARDARNPEYVLGEASTEVLAILDLMRVELSDE